MTASSAPEPEAATAARSLSEIIDAVGALGRDRDTVAVSDVLETLGRASTAALLFVPAVIATTPLSGIPGLSAFCGLIITLVAAQRVLGRRTLWLPGFITRRKTNGTKLCEGLEKVRGIAAFLDRHTHERLGLLVRGPGEKLLFVFCLMGGLMMPFLEIIPFSASLVAACITLISVSILTLDGLIAAFAFVLMGLAGGLLVYFF